jgi:WD40 repeat protein
VAGARPAHRPHKGFLRLQETAPRGAIDNGDPAFSSDGSRFACCAGREAKLWDVGTGRELGSWQLGRGLADSLAFHPTGRLVLCRQEPRDQLDQVIFRELQPTNTIREIRSMPKPAEWIPQLATALGGRSFLVGGSRAGPDGNSQGIRAFDSLTAAEQWSIGLPGSPGNLSVDSEGRLFCLGDGKGQSVLFEASRGTEVGRLPEGPSCLSPGAEHLVRTASNESKRGYTLYRRGTPDPLVVLGIDTEFSTAPRFSRDGSLLAWGNSDGTITVYHLSAIRARLAAVGLEW